MIDDLRRVGVRSATASEGLHHVGEVAVVLDATLGTAGLLLLLFLLLDLGGLSLDLTGTGEGTVHLTSQQWDGQIQFGRGEIGHQGIGGQDGTLARQDQVGGVFDILERGQAGLEWL